MLPIADTQSVEEQLNDGDTLSVAENIDKIVLAGEVNGNGPQFPICRIGTKNSYLGSS